MRLAELAVYVVHAPRLVERRARLEGALAANSVKAHWVEDPDGESLDTALVDRYHSSRRLL